VHALPGLEQLALSNVFLVGESRWWSYRATNVGWSNWFAWSSANRTAGGASHPIVLAAATDPINNPVVDYDSSKPWVDGSGGFTNTLYLGTHTRTFGSRDPGGCYMAMADGSVHFIIESIAIDTYHQLTTRRRAARPCMAATARCPRRPTTPRSFLRGPPTSTSPGPTAATTLWCRPSIEDAARSSPDPQPHSPK
jgi:hypothetical protein